MSAFIERVESELARWGKANPEPENVLLAQTVGKLARVIGASGMVSYENLRDALMMLAHLIDGDPITPLTVEDEWIQDGPGELHNGRWHRLRLRRVPDPRDPLSDTGQFVALLDFANDTIFASVLCEVTLPFEVPEQPIQIAANARRDNALLFPAIAAAGFTPLEVMFSHEQA